MGTAKPDASKSLILAELSAFLGKRSEAQACLKGGLAADGDDPYILLNAAEVQVMLGQASQAVETLKKALERGYPDPFFPVIMPDFLPIRKSPEFRALSNVPD